MTRRLYQQLGDRSTRDITVGPVGMMYTNIGSAVQDAPNGARILVQGGTYNNNFCRVATSIEMRAVNGRVYMTHSATAPNDKGAILVYPGVNFTISGFTITSAVVEDRNGAAIRFEGDKLVIDNCKFSRCQNGLLDTNFSSSGHTVTVTNSEFEYHDWDKLGGGGYNHSIYINYAEKVTVRNCLFHGGGYGHNFKTRSANLVMTSCRLYDETPFISRNIDISNGGSAEISDCIMIQFHGGENTDLLGYAGEGIIWPENSLNVHSCIFVQDPATASYGDEQGNSAYCIRMYNTTPSVRVTHCTLWDSEDSWLYWDFTTRFTELSAETVIRGDYSRLPAYDYTPPTGDVI